MYANRNDFAGKTAFLTGAGGFLGSAAAYELAMRGAAVFLTDIDGAALEKTAAKITAEGGRAVTRVLDVTDSADVNAAIAEAAEVLGHVDISIHIAGGSARIAGSYAPVVRQTDYVFERVMRVNLIGGMYVARAAAAQMEAQGTGGRIISFASVVALNGLAGCTEYAASKGGLIGMTKALAKGVAKSKITVNCVAPGVVSREDTEADEKQHAYACGTNFLGEKCTAEDVAALTAFLASDEARFITGQVYVIDGGRSLAMKGSDDK